MIFYQVLKEIISLYGDQFGEFVCVCLGIKGCSASVNRGQKEEDDKMYVMVIIYLLL